MAVSPAAAGNWRAAMLYGDLLELRISLVSATRMPGRGRLFSYLGYAQHEHIAWRIAMPILQALSREPLPPPSTGSATTARRHGALPMPGLEWNAQVEHDTAHLYERVRAVIPSLEWPFFAPYVQAINALKRTRNAVILAHNYQTPEIYNCVADFVGDSLQLAREATKVDADVIVQCGVHFMAETSKILNPDKTVLIPDLKAGCSLASSITGEDVRLLREN